MRPFLGLNALEFPQKMPLVLLLLAFKVGLSFYGSTTFERAPDTPPLLSLTSIKKNYNGAFFYAVHTLELEHLGDLNGERRSLNTYDPKHLTAWFQSIDALIQGPDLLPFLATFYYGSAGNLKGVCVEFLDQHCDHNPAQKWRWLAHGLHLERDPKKALALAEKLSTLGKTYNLPLWVKDAEARQLKKQGNPNAARLLLQAILDDPNSSLSPEETRFLKGATR